MEKILFFVLFLISLAVHSSVTVQSGQEKATMCAACHGPTGVSMNPMWPNLAGQHAAYLVKQLRDIKTGSLRHADIMMPFVASLSDDDMASLALFYSKQPPSIPGGAQQEEPRGVQLYRMGDVEKKITACIACHGPSGTGNEEAGFPSLTGQHASYAIQQLQAFKENTRQNDLNAIMRTISARMSMEDMKAVADYLAEQDQRGSR